MPIRKDNRAHYVEVELRRGEEPLWLRCGSCGELVFRRRLQELAMLNEMAQDMSSVPDVDEVLRRALRRALEAFESDCGSFLILDPGAGELVVRAAEGPGAEQLIGLRRKLGL